MNTEGKEVLDVTKAFFTTNLPYLTSLNPNIHSRKNTNQKRRKKCVKFIGKAKKSD